MKIIVSERLLAGEEDPDILRQQIENSINIFEKIRKILDKTVYNKERTTKEAFKNPSWPYFRAWEDGYAEGLREAMKLFPRFDKEEM